MSKFYEQEDDTVDVLVLGSSHAFENINTSILWKDYGIAAYDLCGSKQPMWNTYYYLQEALKTQHPRLIILEGYMLTFRSEYADSSRIIKNTYGLKWNANRLQAVSVSTPDDQYAEYLLPITQQHGRYSELSAADFRTNQGNPMYANWKGFGNNLETKPQDQPDVSNVTDKVAMTEKNETYYRKILELAQERNIPIIVVVSPYQIPNDEQAIYNHAADIASEYHVDFYNFNLDYRAIGLDFSTDMADGHHLNHLGNAKFTKVLGQLITQNYPDSYIDRRGDDRYTSWELDRVYYDRTMHNLEIAQSDNVLDAIAMANDENYTILISVPANHGEPIANGSFYDALANRGIVIDRTYGVWTFPGNADPDDIMKIDDYPYHMELLKYNDLLVTTATDQLTTYSFMLNNTDYTSVDDGINLLIYDRSTASVVTAIGGYY